jgi:predicted  nucleic acid-binding Zn-ribbon protein
MQPTDKIDAPARIRRNTKKIQGAKEVTQIDSTEARLNTHEAVCAERYLGLDTKMKTIEDRLDRLDSEVKDLKSSTSKGFAEIKELIEKRNNSSHTALISAAGTIIVALIGFLGYLLTHLK